MKSVKMLVGWMVLLGLGCGLAGCASEGHTSFWANPDPVMRRSAATFAADAAKRSYPATAPRGATATARAEFDQMMGRIDLVNLTAADVQNVEVWINQQYVVQIPTLKSQGDEKLDFEMFYDHDGHIFTTNSGKNPIKTIELYHDGQLFPVLAGQQ